MQYLPIGIQNFETIRKEDFLYVDKTKHLLTLVKKAGNYFLSRPRRFGKSLTLSTIEAMFEGKVELFKGLYAEEWVKEQSKNPSAVIAYDNRHYSKEFFKKENLEKRLLTKEVVEEIVQSVKDKIKAGDRSDIQTYGIDTFEKQRSGGQPLPIQNFPKTGL